MDAAEVVRHREAFGIDEETRCSRQIRGFPAGQKVRLSLAAVFWTKPRLIAVDEPTSCWTSRPFRRSQRL